MFKFAIGVVRKSGLIDLYEVPSKTDKIEDLMERLIDNQRILGNKAGDAYIVEVKNKFD